MATVASPVRVQAFARGARWATPVAFCISLGILLRLFRYALNSPLWWNEAFLAVNFLRRDWGELLQSLDYHQVCPIGFLWIEKGIISLAGFHEWSLRLAPLLFGVASLLGMSLLARVTLPRRAAWFAVLLLAVSYHPIRLAAEVKPYATDLAVSTWTLALAALAIRSREAWPSSVGRLALLSPFFLAVSYPSVFVLAGAALVLVLELWPRADRSTRWRLVALVLAVAVSFCGLQVQAAAAQAQSADTSGMNEFWAEGLPRWDGAGALVVWLFKAHTGPIFAFPAGSGPEVGLPVLMLACAGGWSLGKRNRWGLLGLLAAPFLLTLAAAWLGRYPYGARARLVQHLVPSVCILMTLGGAFLWRRLSLSRPRRRRLMATLTVAMILLGILPLIPDYLRPARTDRELRAREFARAFWPALGDVPIVCVRWDLGILPWDSPNPDVALYLCNQAIYSPERQNLSRSLSKAEPEERSSARYVIFDSPAVPEKDTQPWLVQLRSTVGPLQQQEFWVPGHAGRPARVRVFSPAAWPALSPTSPVPTVHLPHHDIAPEVSHVHEMVTVTR